MKSKLITVGLMLLLSSVSAFAQTSKSQPEVVQKVANWARETQGVQSVGLRAVLELRCGHYLASQFKNPILSQRMNFECMRATYVFMRVLKPTIVKFEHPLSSEPMALQVAFPAELIALPFEPAVVDFFGAWLEGLNRASLGISSLDTFALAQKYAGSEAEALRWMAVLFQDTSAAKVQIQYLKQMITDPTNDQIQAVAKFEEVIDRSIQIFTGQFQTTKAVLFYPSKAPGVALGGLGERIYHYYVPAYLAHRMNQAGLPKATSFFEPFLFNYLYEAIEESNPLLRVFSEPRSFKAGIGDAYLGYLGSLYGAKVEAPVLTRTEFSKAISKPALGLPKIAAGVVRQYRLRAK